MKNSWISVDNKSILPKISFPNTYNGRSVSDNILVTDGKNIRLGYLIFNVDDNSNFSVNRWVFYKLEEEDDWIDNITHWQPLELPD